MPEQQLIPPVESFPPLAEEVFLAEVQTETYVPVSEAPVAGPEPSVWTRKIAALAMAGVLGVSAIIGNSLPAHGERALPPSTSAPLPSDSCPVVEDEYVNKVRELLQTTAPSALDRAANEFEAQPASEFIEIAATQEIYEYLEDKRFNDALQEIAEEHDVTIFDNAGTLRKMPDDSQELKTTPFKTYFDAANEYLDQFGISVVVGRPNNSEPLTPSTELLESEQTKRNLRYIVEAFGKLPKEYVDMLKINKLALYDGAKDEAAAYVVGKDPTVYYDTTTSLGTSVTYHELGHKTDEAVCPVGDDAKYLSLNGDLQYGNNPTGPVYTYEEYLKERDKLQEECGKGPAYIEERMNALAQKVIFFNNARGASEERADLNSQLFNFYMGYFASMDPRMPRVQDKYVYLLARLLKYQPGVAGYAIEATRKDVKPVTAVELCD